MIDDGCLLSFRDALTVFGRLCLGGGKLLVPVAFFMGVFPILFLSKVLSKNKVGVDAATFDQLTVGTLFDDHPLGHDNNVICVADSR